MKGQWFLISAVMAASAFLLISALFKAYFVVDSSNVARTDEDFYFTNVWQQIGNSAVQNPGNCQQLDASLREFKAFADTEVSRMGYLFFLNYTYTCPPASVSPGLMVASDRMIVCRNVNTDDILPNNVVGLSCS